MALKLLEVAQQRGRRLNAAERLPLVRAGVCFVDGLPRERVTTMRLDPPAARPAAP